MAQPPDINETFLREVDENLRRDQMRDFAKKYGNWIGVFVVLFLAACGSKEPSDPKAEAPPPAQVEREADASLVKLDHPDQFAISTAAAFDSTPTLDVTGVVSPDTSTTRIAPTITPSTLFRLGGFSCNNEVRAASVSRT